MALGTALDDLRRRLLDLTRRNRLLHLPPSARSVLRLVDERPEPVWRRLVDEERTLRLRAREEADPAVRARIDAAVEDARRRGTDEEGGLEVAPPPPPSGGDGPAPRPDERALQTALEGKVLDARLLALERAARACLEEQGANALYVTLGVVGWRETPDGPVCRAPLLFVPVALERASVTSRHVLRPLDDDLVLNPCLEELVRRTTRTGLPPFEPEADPFDVVAFLARVREAVEGVPGWTWHEDVTVGLYSFSKYRLWRDLDPAAWPDGALTAHPMVRLLLGEPGPAAGPGPAVPAPASPAPSTSAAPAADPTPPEAPLHVVDADASQAAVVAAARAGASLVVDGPPGTGKSQTIANLIAGLLADGKRVLFVAEKAAALDVVRRRLEAVGLGDALLELHSRKQSKRAVLERIGRALDRAAAAAPAAADDSAALRRAHDACAAVHAALHRPTGPLARSVYDLVGRAAALDDAPALGLDLPALAAADAAALEAAVEAAATLDRRRTRVPDPATHPWRGTGLTTVDEATRRRVAAGLDALPRALDAARAAGVPLAARLGVGPPEDAARLAALLGAADALATADGLDPSTAVDPRWRAADAALARLEAALAARTTAAATWAPVFGPEAEAQAFDDVLARRRAHGGSLLRWLRPTWHADRRRLAAVTRPDAPRDRRARAAALEALVAGAAARRTAEAEAAPLAPLLGATWAGPTTDAAAVATRRRAATAAAAAVEAGLATPEAVLALASPTARAALAAAAAPARAALAGFDAAAAALVGALATTEAAWFGGPARAVPFPALAARHAPLPAALDALDDAAGVVDAVRRCEAAGLGPFVGWSEGAEGRAAAGRFAAAVERHALRGAADAAIAADPALAGFRGEDHAALLARFRAADRAALLGNRARVLARLAARRPDLDGGTGRETKLGLLRAQLRLKRGHLPVRRLLERAGDVVAAVTPCFLMSPLSVAHHLAPGGLTFDVVVFDEASQVEPADALGAVARARQVVWFGDERQLPPTTFFAKTTGDADEGDDPADDAAAGRLESVLSLALARLPARSRASLSWHYRSRDPSLVEFSNRRFYGGALVTFPAPAARRTTAGVFFRPVAPGDYRRGAGQSNPTEARAVVDAVMAHARAWVRAGGGDSLGVGAMSVAQQRAIEDEVERRRREDPTKETEPFFAPDRDEPFFVKNLETIQGDERDVVLLSVGYGADPTGRVTMAFGPLNQADGWRRLNVLVTRARARVEVFSTLRASDLKVTDATPAGVAALAAYLRWAEEGVAAEDAARSRRVHPGGTEAALARALAARGLTVHAQVGDGPGGVDLAVVDPDDADRYVLGLEGDGRLERGEVGAGDPGGPPDRTTTRDRDRLRPEVLARMGWTLERVGSVDWHRRPRAVVERVVAAVAAARSRHGGGPGPAVPAPAAGVPPPAAAAPGTSPGASSGPATEAPAGPPTGLVPYPSRAAPVGDADDLVAAPAARVAAWLRGLVGTEGPIHVEEAMRALVAAHRARATARPREAFERGLERLLASGGAERRGDFLWSVGATAARVRWRGGDCPVTDPDLVAPEEWDEAVRGTVAAEFGGAEDAIVAATLRRLGFPRAGARPRAAAEGAVARLAAAGVLVRDAAGEWVLRPGGAGRGVDGGTARR